MMQFIHPADVADFNGIVILQQNYLIALNL